MKVLKYILLSVLLSVFILISISGSWLTIRAYDLPGISKTTFWLCNVVGVVYVIVSSIGVAKVLKRLGINI